MSRILIVYGTTEGHTAKIADAIAQRLRTAAMEANVVQAGTGDLPPAGYDGVIVAASIHAGGYQKPIAEWLRRHIGEFETKPTAFVSVCLAINSRGQRERDEAVAIPKRFVASLGWRPTVVKVVAGALPYTKYNLVTRWVMKRIAAAAGGDTDTTRDYEYTDWQDLSAFVDRFAALVHPAVAVRA